MILEYFALKKSIKSLLNFLISFIGTSNKSLLFATHSRITCSCNGKGFANGCFSNSTNRLPCSKSSLVALSKSELNWVNTSISRYCAKSIRKLPAAFFMAFVWAAPPTRDTLSPTLTAGLMPAKNNSVSKNI